ncbi:MAG: mechanosensitive ion channel family protein [Thiohalophilus sp.]|jgi:small-conductance mechanosensitive channel
MEFLQTEIANNPLLNWLIAVAIMVSVIIVTTIVRFTLSRQFNRLAKRTEQPGWSTAQAVVNRTSWLFILVLGMYVGKFALDTPAFSGNIAYRVMVVALLIQAGLWVAAATRVLISQYQERQMSRDPASVTTLNLLNFVARMAIWIFVLLLVLDNLGVNITALIAGLGIGGIAIALALQTVLSDLLASLSIVLDKPFVVGDFLIVGDLMGSVEYVGLKTTRLRSLSGEQLVFSNTDLLNSRIRNYGRMYERRVVFNIGVTYQTPREKLIKIPKIIQEAIEQQENTRFDRSHFKEYGNFSLNYETVYFVLSSDYNQYMDTHQAINFYIHEQFEKEQIEFAYPTQTLFVEKSTIIDSAGNSNG